MKETVDLRFIYQNELGKACFQHDMVYGNFKNFNRRTAPDKVLCDKAFKIQNMVASMVYNFFD